MSSEQAGQSSRLDRLRAAVELVGTVAAAATSVVSAAVAISSVARRRVSR